MVKMKLWSTKPATANQFSHRLSIMQNDDFKSLSAMYIMVPTPATTFMYIKYIGKAQNYLQGSAGK